MQILYNFIYQHWLKTWFAYALSILKQNNILTVHSSIGRPWFSP